MVRRWIWVVVLVACSCKPSLSPEQEQAIAEQHKIAADLAKLKDSIRKLPEAVAAKPDPRLQRVGDLLDTLSACAVDDSDAVLATCLRRALIAMQPAGAAAKQAYDDARRAADQATDKLASAEKELAAVDQALAVATKSKSSTEVEQLKGEHKRLADNVAAAKTEAERTKALQIAKQRCLDNPHASGC